MKKPITQEDQNGCGVACTAFLLKLTYQETKKLFDASKVEKYGSDCPDIVQVLNKKGLEYDWREYRNEEIPEKAVVYLKPSSYYKMGHYLVKSGTTWMNPWIWGKTISTARSGFVKTLHGNIKYLIYPINKGEN